MRLLLWRLIGIWVALCAVACSSDESCQGMEPVLSGSHELTAGLLLSVLAPHDPTKE